MEICISRLKEQLFLNVFSGIPHFRAQKQLTFSTQPLFQMLLKTTEVHFQLNQWTLVCFAYKMTQLSFIPYFIPPFHSPPVYSILKDYWPAFL